MNWWMMALIVFAACDAFGLERSSLKARAANDLRCEAKQIETHEIGNHSWKVTGCGTDATYTCIRSEGIGERQWSCVREK